MIKPKLPKIKKVTPLDNGELKAFLRFLPSEIKLLVEAYIEAEKIFSLVGLGYQWKEIFLLTKECFHKSGESPAIILFARSSSHRSQNEFGFCTCIPEKLEKKLIRYMQTTKGSLLFQRKDGKAHTIKSLGIEFKKASELAKEKTKLFIIPSDLRISPPKEIHFKPGFHRIISDEHLEKINDLLIQKANKIGCPRNHGIKEILEALLDREYFELSRSQFIKKFPCAIAAESQLRRWRKAGIWEQIFKVFQE